MSDISARSTDEILKPATSYGSTVGVSISTRGSLDSGLSEKPGQMQRLREFIKKLRGKSSDSSQPSADQPAVNRSTLKSGPSSVRTVLLVAGLMCVGFMLVTSGIILLTTEHNRSHQAFLVTGSVFICLGVLFFVVCLVVQRKNFLKHVERLEKDLYHS